MLLIVAMLAAGSLAAPTVAECVPADPKAVTAVVQEMFDAAAAQDAGRLAAVIAPGFYAFDVGKRYDKASFQTAMLSIQRPDNRITWHVTEPDVHIGCGSAWVAYVNRGSLIKAGQVTALTWLESAELTYVGGRWRIAFLNSGRANPA